MVVGGVGEVAHSSIYSEISRFFCSAIVFLFFFVFFPQFLHGIFHHCSSSFLSGTKLSCAQRSHCSHLVEYIDVTLVG